MIRWTIVFLAACGCAFGWGKEGHALIARIAEARLTPEARGRVAAVLGPGVSLDSIASWPDEVRRQRRETGPWHYVNVPLSRPALDMARDCKGGECVIAKIEEFRKTLGSRDASERQRREALLFVVHLVGDMHQPLHVVDNGDQGGNDVQVRFFGRETNLHAVWDSQILDRMGPEAELLKTLEAGIRKEDDAAWGRGNPEQWAGEAHRIARKVVYGKMRGKPVKELGEVYQRAAEPVIRGQLERAGVRLAELLNEAFR